MKEQILCQQEAKVNLAHRGWSRCIYLARPVQLQVMGDLKAVSAGANKSFMKALSSSITAQLVFGCLNAPPETLIILQIACTAGNTQA